MSGETTLVALRQTMKSNNRCKISAYLVIFVLLGLSSFNSPSCFDDVKDSTQELYPINSQVFDAKNSGDFETFLYTRT